MLVVTHELFLKSQPADIRIEIRLYQPVQFDRNWGCRYEIDWPEGSKATMAYGLDALQALVLVLQMIGSELYTSAYHADGLLRASSQEAGYGFPVPPILRDMLIGGDALSF